FDIKIKDKKEAENLAADHLSRRENLDLGAFTKKEITDKFLDEHLMILKTMLNDDEPWGHHSASITRRKVYESGFFWPSIFKDAKDYMMRCDVMHVKDLETYHQGVRCLRIIFRTAYKTPTRCTPFRLAYGKACHLPVEMEHKAYWALKQCNMNLTAAAKNFFMELNELMELRDGAYKNTRIYKERTKRLHDSRLRGDKNFKVGDKVLLFNSRFKMHPGKLKSRWYDPNVVSTLYPYGTRKITDKNKISYKVNGQWLKKYHDGHIDIEDKEVVDFKEEYLQVGRKQEGKCLT
nr:hypothetical protein [Tanacetum cinerariifolium]